MKCTSLAVLALMGIVSAGRHHHHGRHLQPIGVLMQLRHIDEWDASKTKFMDADNYVKDVKNSIDLGDGEKPKYKRHHHHNVSLNQKSKQEHKKEEQPAAVKPAVQLQNNNNIAEANKPKKYEGPHRYDNTAEDRKQFAELELNTRTVKDEIRRSSDNFDQIQEQNEKKKQNQLFQEKAKRLQQEKETENAEKKVQLMQSAQERELNNDISEMNNQWNLFQRGLDVDNWEKAQALWARLEQNGHPQDYLKVNTRKFYEAKFAFPEMAKNDFAVQQLENLETAQINLNNNSDNKSLLNKFIAVAQETTEKLIQQYPDTWSDPAMEIKKEMRSQQFDQKATSEEW